MAPRSTSSARASPRRAPSRTRCGWARGSPWRARPRRKPMQPTPEAVKPGAALSSPVTDHVAGFVVDTRDADLPKDVQHLGKRSVIDGIGLALAGAASECGHIA